MEFTPVLSSRATIADPRKQRGVVLVIALIVLIVMMLAGMGMMRSVDTGSIIAGNIAFKQSTVNGGDRAIDDAYSVLTGILAVPTDKVVLNFSNGGPCPAGVNTYLCTTNLLGSNVVNLPGYSSAVINQCEVSNTCTTEAQKQWWKFDANWADASPPAIETDANGNQVASVSYLIHRMCTKADVATNDNTNLCQTFDDGGHMGLCNGCSKKVGALYFPAKSVFYRITARSLGPRNTVTYTQALVLIAE